jgi:DNA polymerase-4
VVVIGSPMGFEQTISEAIISALREHPSNGKVYQVTALTPTHLEMGFGRRARFLSNALQGIDNAPVLPVGQKPPVVMLNHAFGTDTNKPAAVEGALYRLVEQAGRRLRRQGRVARRVHSRVDYSDGRRCVRQAKIRPASANDLALFPFARRALNLAWHRRVRIRHLRLTFDRLVFPPAQMPLFEEERQTFVRQENIVAAMDKIRNRFGPEAINMGRI